jgi:hypothetical protein
MLFWLLGIPFRRHFVSPQVLLPAAFVVAAQDKNAKIRNIANLAEMPIRLPTLSLPFQSLAEWPEVCKCHVVGLPNKEVLCFSEEELYVRSR